MPAPRDSKLKPIASVDEGVRLVDSFEGDPEDFQLAVPDSLLDTTGLNIAIITDRVLARDWGRTGSCKNTDTASTITLDLRRASDLVGTGMR